MLAILEILAILALVLAVNDSVFFIVEASDLIWLLFAEVAR